MQMTKSLTHSVGGYLPNTITEMWEPSRDFAFFHLPTSGVRSVVALSGWVSSVFSVSCFVGVCPICVVTRKFFMALAINISGLAFSSNSAHLFFSAY